eukprot:1105421-Amphidinium_carterae.2
MHRVRSASAGGCKGPWCQVCVETGQSLEMTTLTAGRGLRGGPCSRDLPLFSRTCKVCVCVY